MSFFINPSEITYISEVYDDCSVSFGGGGRPIRGPERLTIEIIIKTGQIFKVVKSTRSELLSVRTKLLNAVNDYPNVQPMEIV